MILLSAAAKLIVLSALARPVNAASYSNLYGCWQRSDNKTTYPTLVVYCFKKSRMVFGWRSDNGYSFDFSGRWNLVGKNIDIKFRDATQLKCKIETGNNSSEKEIKLTDCNSVNANGLYHPTTIKGIE
ncbi:hypothetical protein [Microvirga rosea]|uniref:hypothetical protein n=1 Tax=Microvirga rosea TaxID=2715425 RepID=UPI001D0A6E4A|nr:hypothetical protein [Microvirga rosea]MCB8821458.1 hypothetical protein [Microvirga rosea]